MRGCTMHPVTFSVKRIHWSVLRRFRAFVRERIDEELTPGRFDVLRLVNVFKRHGFVFQARIARVFGVAKSSTSRILKALERGGYIERFLFEDDRRFKLVTITQKGLAIIERFVCAYVGREYQDAFEDAFLHGDAQPPSYEHLYVQLNLVRVGLDDPAPFLHPWQERPLVEERTSPLRSILGPYRDAALHVEDVDDRIADLEDFDMD